MQKDETKPHEVGLKRRFNPMFPLDRSKFAILLCVYVAYYLKQTVIFQN